MREPLRDAERRLLVERLVLAQRAAAKARATDEGIPRRPHGVDVPLALGQEQIYIHQRLAGDVPLYNEPFVITPPGAVDHALLRRCLEHLVHRHSSLRTTYEMRGDHPIQVVHDAVPSFDFPLIECGALSDGGREAKTRAVAEEQARSAMDLERGPLFRAAHLRFEHHGDCLVLTIHQLAFDGTSVYDVLLPELAIDYDKLSRGETVTADAPAPEYADFAHWQRSVLTRDALRGQLEYWGRALHGLEPLALPADRQRGVLSYRGAQERFTLGEELSRSLRAFARQEGVTTFVTMLAALCALLRRHTGETDIAVGTPSSVRSRQELDHVFGNLINTVVIRTDVSGRPGFRELVQRVRFKVGEALSNNEVPPHWLVRQAVAAHGGDAHPLFQVMLVVEPTDGRAVDGWTATAMAVGNKVARVDLSLEIEESSRGLAGRFRYDADLFSAETARAMSAQFCRLLREAAKTPDRSVVELPLLDDERAAKATTPVASPLGFVPFDRDAIEQTLARRFEEQAGRFPDAAAVAGVGGQTTYGALDAVANNVARGLLAFGQPGDRVALLLGHDATMAAGLLGTLKAGRVYVPIDVTHPAARIELILRDAGASVLLATESQLDLAARLSDGEIPVLSVDRLSACPPLPLTLPTVAPTAPAYILYTSGSTGEPKGVVQNHRNVLHFIACYTNNLRIAHGDRLTLISSYSVDAAVMDIFGALFNGATLCPIDLRQVGFTGLADALRRMQISVYHSTPTVYRHLASTLTPERAPSSVRLVVLGGEEVVRQDVEAFKQLFDSRCVLVNGFGPTESTVTLQHFVRHDTVVDRTSVPVGHPVEATDVLLLGPNLERGQVYGEIAVRSEHVAVGYWERPDLDAIAFLPDPGPGSARVYRTGDMGRVLPDATLAFAGRRDQQVKVHGYRVEIGEVEAALARAPRVSEAVVVARGEPGDKRLVAYLVGRGGRPDLAAVRRFLAERLPTHMIPTAIVVLDALPTTPSGKLDRRALPDPPRHQAEAGGGRNEARTRTEAVLLDIWRTLLGQGDIRLQDEFFALGGNSLMAVQLFGEIESRLGCRLPLAVLLQAGSIEALAARVDAAAAAPTLHARSPLVTIQEGRGGAPLFCVHPIGGEVLCYRELASGLGVDQTVYGLKLDPDELGDGPLGVETLAARYIAELRTLQPVGPYRIAGYSFGGLVAYEMAQQLDDPTDVALLALIDSFFASSNRGLVRTALRASLNTVTRLPSWVWHDFRAVSLRENGRLAWRKVRRAGIGIASALRGGPLAPTLADLSDGELARHFPTSRVPLVRALSRASTAYSPRPYGGCVTLFRAQSQPLFSADDSEEMWRRLAGRLEVHLLPGRHRHLLEGQSLVALCRLLGACLRGDGSSHSHQPAPGQSPIIGTAIEQS